MHTYEAPVAAPRSDGEQVGLVDAIRGVVSKWHDGNAVFDAASIDAYRQDFAPLCPSGDAIALVRPRTTQQVSEILQLANELRVPVVPQGARTGLAGAANAIDGCILLSMERMNAIRTIDPLNQIAVVQPGVINADFSAAVAAMGLYYPPDPASWEMSTIGGNVATNAGGLCCIKYGVTGDFVRGLEVVLADGRILRTGRRTVKGVAGYDLTHLLAGSEGTLGVITEITLGLVPKSSAPLTAVSFHSSMEDACGAVGEVLARGIQPSLLELMDRPSIDAVSRHTDVGFPGEAQAVLLMQSDRGDQAPNDLDRFRMVAEEFDGDVVVSSDPAEARLLLQARRLLAVALEEMSAFLSDDVCVPRSKLAELVSGVAEISARSGLLITCSGHAGDGNMHPTVLFDKDDPAQVETAQRAFEDIMSLGLRLGGTITGEHGVGLLKSDWLALELGEVGVSVHHTIKAALDPNGILNPGKVLAQR
jgi:glycolate oxidase